MINPKTTLVSLSNADQELCFAFISNNEGLRLKAYDDETGKEVDAPQGNLTIGYGTNLTEFNVNHALLLLQYDLVICEIDLKQEFDWYPALSPIRKIVMLDMCYNLGIAGLKTFTNDAKAGFIDLMATENYNAAGNDLETSLWAKEVKTRATKDIYMIQNNSWLVS